MQYNRCNSKTQLFLLPYRNTHISTLPQTRLTFEVFISNFTSYKLNIGTLYAVFLSKFPEIY